MSNFAENNKELESRVNYMISTLDETIKSQQTQFTSYINEVNSIINSQVSGYKALFAELEDKMIQYKELISTTTNLQSNMQEVAAKLLSAGNNFAESANSFEYINESVEQLKDLSAQELERFNESINQWNVQVNAIKSVENSISNILEKVHESLVGYSEQTNNSLKEYLTQYDEQMTNITRHFSFSIQEFDEKLEGLNEILERKIGANN
jgi:chromosome segregation ATPase